MNTFFFNEYFKLESTYLILCTGKTLGKPSNVMLLETDHTYWAILGEKTYSGYWFVMVVFSKVLKRNQVKKKSACFQANMKKEDFGN